jgi:protein-tyrosine phosphatase
MAKAYFSYLLSQEKLDSSIRVDSAGLGPWHEGEGADHRVYQILQRYQIPIEHTAKQIRSHWIDQFDYVIAMDRENIATLKQFPFFPRIQPKVYLFSSFHPDPPSIDVPDPYLGTLADFDQVFHLIQLYSHAFLDFLKREHAFLKK